VEVVLPGALWPVAGDSVPSTVEHGMQLVVVADQ